MSLFLILSWIAIITALATRSSRQKPRLLLPGQVDEEFRNAQSKNDHAALIRYYRLALERPLAERDTQLIRINLAYSLSALEEYEQALTELDRVSLKILTLNQVVLWLNNRAYNLAKLDRVDEALDHLQDAQELLVGDDGLSKDAALASCIHSTRGMVLLQKGDLEHAEKSLQLALRLEIDNTTVQFDSVTQEGDPGRTAERYYWLSEISKRRGNEAERQARLKQAARFPFTEYGNKALQVLRPSKPEQPSTAPSWENPVLSPPIVRKILP